jgi:geranylgeranyl transferase type-1 subunit beta
MKRLDSIDKSQAIHWCISRQHEGFHGRVNKPDDTCYSYWIGSALDILGHANLIDTITMERYLEKTKSKYGGYGKTPDAYPDLMHSYMGLAGLAIVKSTPLKDFYTPLGCSQRVFDFLKNVHLQQNENKNT